MLLNEDEKTIITRIANGDSEAENYLFLRFRDRIQFLVRARLKGKIPKEDQEDIVSEIQQAILLSLRKGGYNPELGKPLEAYIAGITGNIVGQYFRRLKKSPISEVPLGEKVTEAIDLQNYIENPGNVLSEMIDNERSEKLRTCLYKIKPKYLEVLILRIYDNKTIDEIAKQLNIERRRVSERINYAFKLLLIECKKEKFFNK